MIETSFCHLPGISLTDETEFWRQGIRTWNDLLCWASVFADDARYAELQSAIADSKVALASQRPGFFLKDLPESEWYRVYCDFPAQIHCLDIETDGLREGAKITCLSVLSAGEMCTFISGDNLGLATEKLAEIRIAVTFNGTRFDIPRLMRHFPGFCPRFHLDLAKVLRTTENTGQPERLWQFDSAGNKMGKPRQLQTGKMQRERGQSISDQAIRLSWSYCVLTTRKTSKGWTSSCVFCCGVTAARQHPERPSRRSTIFRQRFGPQYTVAATNMDTAWRSVPCTRGDEPTRRARNQRERPRSLHTRG